MFAGNEGQAISRMCKVLILALLANPTTGLNGSHPMAECSGSIQMREQDGFLAPKETIVLDPDQGRAPVVPVRAETSRHLRNDMDLRVTSRAVSLRSVARRRRSLTVRPQDMAGHHKAIMDRRRDLMDHRSAIRMCSIAELRPRVAGLNDRRSVRPKRHAAALEIFRVGDLQLNHNNNAAAAVSGSDNDANSRS